MHPMDYAVYYRLFLAKYSPSYCTALFSHLVFSFLSNTLLSYYCDLLPLDSSFLFVFLSSALKKLVLLFGFTISQWCLKAFTNKKESSCDRWSKKNHNPWLFSSLPLIFSCQFEVSYTNSGSLKSDGFNWEESPLLSDFVFKSSMEGMMCPSIVLFVSSSILINLDCC